MQPQTDSGLHPAAQQILEMQQAQQQQQPNLLNLIGAIGRGMAVSGQANWATGGMARGMREYQAAQQSGMNEMNALQMLQASNQLYELEDRRRQRRLELQQQEQARERKRQMVQRLRDAGEDAAADALEADMLTASDLGGVLGFGGGQATYGTTPHYERDPETGQTYVVRYASDGTAIRRPTGGVPFSVERAQPEFLADVERAKETEKLRLGTISTISEGYHATKSQLDRTSSLLEDFESGKYAGKTGPLRGRINQFFDPDVAELEMLSINEALQNLGITNLAPVSNYEIGLVRQLYAGKDMTEAQNIAILRKLKAIQEAKLATARRALQRLKTEGYESYMLNPEGMDLGLVGERVPSMYDKPTDEMTDEEIDREMGIR